MKTSMKWLSVLLVLCLLVVGISAVTAFAETEEVIISEAEKDGIIVSLKLSDENYEKTGKMSLVLNVANDGDKKLKDIKTSITMPDALLIKDGELIKDAEAMNYHALLTNEIVFAHQNSPVIIDDPDDPNYSGNGQGGDKGQNGGLPSWVVPVVLIAIAVIAAGVLIFLFLTGRLKKGKNICLLLMIGLLVFSLAPAVNATEDETVEDQGNTLTVQKEVTIEGETVLVSATATWEYADPNPDNSTLTRADMEKAIADIAFTWYYKGTSYDYDSATLNALTQHLCDPLCGYAGGKTKLTAFPVMENATSHSSVYTVCSGFCWDVYYTALGYPILGSKYNCLTMTLWRNTSYPDDMAVLRWHTKGQGVKYNNYDTTYNVKYNNWYSAKGVYDFFWNYEENMRPGDIIVFDNPGHAVMYIGNGYVMDAGGKKYSMDTGTDSKEAAVKFTHIYDYYFDPDNKNFDLGALGWCENSIVVVRPLDLLTIDDGDGDPGNDKINTNYKLRTGLLNYQFDHDKTNVVKTSDYGFDDVTHTRLENTGMTINRTSSITPYGTATKGGTITYSVVVANNSNNMDYLTYQEAGGNGDYEGVTYEDLWVVEYIPEGTELESALGAIIDGNTLRWNADIPAGESRTFAYTVRVTGDVGDTIVSTGGWVANIPSNTIENRIGGKQLPNKVKGKMTNFFEAGRDAWNSNEGYKVSANVNAGTQFAERIYQVTTGLDLQLPDVQEIMDIFFYEYKYYTPDGLYLYHDSNGITRHMYRLNSKAPNAKDQIYYNMLVPGYYGGLWCYTDEYNGENRITELREEYLEPGDIFIYLDLTEAEEEGAVYKKREVVGYTVMVYLGNSSYASLNSEGRMDPIDTAFGVTSAFTHDLFVCLRPRQAFEDITKDLPEFTGTAPDLTEADMRKTYKPNPSLILLNEVGCKQFAEMSINDFEWTKVNGVFPGEVYSKLGMDIVTNGTDDASFATMLKYLFLDVEDESAEYREFGHHYFKLEEPKYGAEKWNDMLIYYAGYAIDDTSEVPITSMKDLHPGDIVMVGSRTSRFYVTTVYQGNGDFLLNVQSLQLSGIESKIWGELHFNSDKEFLAWLNSNIAPFAETLDRRGRFDPTNRFVKDLRYECYLVVRPSRAFENINEMVKRNIKDGALTTAEKNVLAKLSVEDFKNGPKKLFNLAAVSTWAYGKAGVNTSIYLGSNSIYAARNLIFKWAGSKMELRMSYDDEFNNEYRTMLVPESYGGTAFNSSFIITPDMLQVGDLFCGAQSATVNGQASTRYVVGIYQGNGKFLFIENGGAKGNIASYDTKSVFSKNIGKEWSYYYILRPDRLATVKKVVDEPPVYPEFPADPTLRFIDAYKLASWETEAIANLTFDNWSANCASYQLTNILPWVYKQAGIDIAMDKYGYQALTWAGANDSANTKGSYYNKILVSGSRGSNVKGSGIKDSQIGDIFGGRVVVKGKDGADVNLYYGAVYQGDGKWMAFYDTYSAGEKGHETKILSVEDLDAITWNFRYVLRPQQLASKEPPAEKPVVPAPRDITTGKLTDREKTSLSILTPTNIAYPSKHLYGTLPEYYKAVGIIVDMKNKTHEGTRDQLFAKDGSTLVLRTEATDDTMAYFQAMNIGVYGGSMFAEADRTTLAKAVSDGKLQIGDVIAGYYVDDCDGTKTNTPFTALYQGNNKFLVVYPQWDGSKQSLVKAQVSARQIEVLDFLYYYTLRPENLNDIVVPSEPRDITTGKLTDAEKEALSKLTGSDIGYPTRMLYGTLPEFYKAVGITVNMAGNKMTQEGIRNQLFSLESGVLILRTEATDDIMHFYQKMRVAVQGGSLFAEADRVSISDAITAGVLQIGDVIAGSHTDTYGENQSKDQYITAMYQGENTFLVYYYAYDEAAGKDAMNRVTWSTAQLEALTFKYYYTLRPENLAETDTPDTPDTPDVPEEDEGGIRDISKHKLTETEKAILASLTADDMAKLSSVHVHTTIPTAYSKADIALNGHGKTASGTFGLLFKKISGSDYYAPAAASTDEVTKHFQTMLTDCYGGKSFETSKKLSEADLQIGDVFVGYIKYTAGNRYWSGIYQGEGNFLMFYSNEANQFKIEVLKIADIENTANYDFVYYFILRPENLATEAAPDVRVVTWVNEDGTVLERDLNAKVGSMPNYNGAEPAKAATEQFTYTFAGWTPEIAPVSGDVTYTATFTEVARTYTVTWVDEEDNILETDETVPYGTTPIYDGETPTKAADAQYTYTFAGWTPAVEAVTDNVTYKATFTETVNTYTVVWKNHDGSILETDENVPYGTIPTYDGEAPTKAADAQHTYTFVGWDTEVAAITGDAVYTATFADASVAYTVIWKNEDGTELEKDENVQAGTIPTYDGETPTKAPTATATYTFAGWTPAVEAVSGDVTYTATFTEVPVTYTVIWKNEDGTELETDENVPYGTVPTFDGEAPTKVVEGSIYTYTFAGWDKEVVAVTGDVTYTATFTYSRSLTASMLTDEEMSILASLTTTDVQAAGLKGDNFSNVVPWIYQQAHIDGSTELNINIYALAGKFFTLKSGTWTLNSTIAAPYTDMLVYGAYGGTQMNKAPAFNVNTLQVGDIFCGVFDKAQTGASSTLYCVYLYQGNGNFLQVAKTGSEVLTYTQLLAKTFENGGTNYNWSYFFAIRPERYNTTRDIALRTLTEQEETALASLVVGNIVGLGSGHLRGFVPHLYKLAGITLDLKNQTASGAFGQIFIKPSGSNYYVPKEASDDETVKYFQTMFTGIYGGSDFETGTKLSTVELQIGDVFVGVNKCPSANRNWSGVYQGNGNFLMYYWDNANAGHTEVVSISTLEDANSCNFKFYFILRPENLAKEYYTVVWQNEDGAVLETDSNVLKGTTPTYNGVEPTKAPTAQYSYTFAGWTPAVSAATGNATYTATYTEAPRTYTVTWLNTDGTELEKDENVPYGSIPTYDGAEPTKPSTAEHNYIFAGWTPAVEAVADDVVYTAVFSEVGATYTILWNNDDGTELEKDENVAYGATPTYNGEVPTKAADAQYTYTFAGWTPAISAVTGNMTYVASYDAVLNTYTVIWVNDDGTELEKDENVPYGTVPTYDGETPVKTAPVEGYTYTYAGWNAEVAAVTGNVTYTAAYSHIRTLAAHGLTEEEMALLAAITPEDVKAGLTANNLNSVGPWIYSQANINASTELGITVHNLRNKILYSKGVYPTTNSSYSAEYGPTLVTNSQGGTQMTDAPVTFDVGYLQVGDLFCSSFFGSTDGNLYYVFLYQGNNQFLYLNKDNADYYSSEQILAMTHDFAGTEKGWTYHYVIRPERYNGATRDLALRKLTNAEKHAISKLDINSTLCGGNVDLNKVMPLTYQAIGVNLSTAEGYALDSGNNVRKALFGNSNCKLLTAETSPNAALFNFYSKILVDGLYGGSAFTAAGAGTTALNAENLQIGDILCAYVPSRATVGEYTFGSSTSYFVLIYQGNGQFDGCMNVAKQGTTARAADWDGATLEQMQKIIEANAFGYYYVIRPELLTN